GPARFVVVRLPGGAFAPRPARERARRGRRAPRVLERIAVGHDEKGHIALAQAVALAQPIERRAIGEYEEIGFFRLFSVVLGAMAHGPYGFHVDAVPHLPGH